MRAPTVTGYLHRLSADVVAAVIPTSARLKILLCALWLVSGPLLAEPQKTGEQRGDDFTVRARYLQEQDARLSPEEAISALQRDLFNADSRAVPSFGIGARPVWIYLPLSNTSPTQKSVNLAVGKPWIDQLNVYLVRGDRVVRRWSTDGSGDESGDGAAQAAPGIGYLFPLTLASGRSGILIRASSAEPLVLDVALLSDDALAQRKQQSHYGHGLLYGFLLAFVCGNAMLCYGLRERSNGLYSLYLFGYIALSFIYSGHSNMWPDNPFIQRYGLSLALVLFCSAGFLFACRFLHLDTYAASTQRWGIGIASGAVLLVFTGAAADVQWFSVWAAFLFAAVFIVGVVYLGLLSGRHGERAGRYFLGAALCSVVGLAVTLSAFCGLLPLNTLTFHAVEIGLVLEATLFSLAVARRVRSQEEACRAAEQLSRTDALTGLLNRRAFDDDAASIWSTAVRHNRPLSVIMLDIDRFKAVNDRLGHPAGDRVLVQISRLLASCSREGDKVGRWGGEEFVVLLPETSVAQARRFAERLRRAVSASKIAAAGTSISLSISLGAAERGRHRSLSQLICDADKKLCEAKRRGRNCVVSTGPREATA
ncbi:diguanylate cyclase (GGDEF) domain-containing protein [Microbulbifer donghaiensis]|uniref:diguanylate cyclase n=1 Tax=Microbulbifer donghaiensis TaxID=494016 RepID=A0A1M4X7D6_9GAMM|nr:diguanylate cyclase [Microbulbifer donghaiensis]SHE89419.1 diguanylate cyclase (GGDEF) domain-containing protein [Microbulbifer donghaiensis]